MVYREMLRTVHDYSTTLITSKMQYVLNARGKNASSYIVLVTHIHSAVGFMYITNCYWGIINAHNDVVYISRPRYAFFQYTCTSRTSVDYEVYNTRGAHNV
jgi:hypothetical protein